MDWLLAEFRLLVNESIRSALREDIRSRTRLARAAYADLSGRHLVHKKYISSAFEVALTLLRAHRRRLRKGNRSSVPYLRTLMLKADNQAYWLDRETGRVPMIKVNPAWTSKTCPACGARRRDRVGKDFVCLVCDWEMDRQINAGLNILKSALASNEALARAVRFQPGALRDDVVIPLYDLPEFLEGAREEPSGVESRQAPAVT